MLLSVKDIVVGYGEFQALHGISLEVNEGEVVAILGSNGAGKSTTIKTVSGQLPLKSGSIEFMGKEISKVPVYDRVEMGIVQVPEGRRLFPYLTIEDNLLAGSYCKAARKDRAQNLERCYSIFPKLYERRKQQAVSLSGGEQQMCAIARGLMQNPKLMMLDEPSLGLAPIIVEDIFKTMTEINKQGVTILLVEQNVGFSVEVANRLYVIETGSNVMNGTGEDLKNSPDLQKAYLGL